MGSPDAARHARALDLQLPASHQWDSSSLPPKPSATEPDRAGQCPSFALWMLWISRAQGVSKKQRPEYRRKRRALIVRTPARRTPQTGPPIHRNHAGRHLAVGLLSILLTVPVPRGQNNREPPNLVHHETPRSIYGQASGVSSPPPLRPYHWRGGGGGARNARGATRAARPQPPPQDTKTLQNLEPRPEALLCCSIIWQTIAYYSILYYSIL